MITTPVANPEGTTSEILALIEALHTNGQRLEELTGGEVDTVADRQGRTFVLRRAQEHLRQSDAAKQAAILNALPAHIALLDAQGNIVSVNEAWRTCAGDNALRGPDCAVGCDYLEICENAHGKCSFEAGDVAIGIRGVLAGKAKAFSMEYSCDSPTRERWFLLSVTPLAEAPPSGAIVMHTDISALRKSSSMLDESEVRFRQLAENIGSVFYLVDNAAHRILYVSPAYEQVWGRPVRSAYSERAWAESIVPEDRARVLAERRGEISSKPFVTEYRIARPDGNVRWIRSCGFPIADKAGKVYRIAGIAEDITERVRLENAMRESGAGLRRAQEAARLAHVVTKADGVFESCSDTLSSLIGLDPATMPRDIRGWLELIHPDDREHFRAAQIDAANRRQRTEIEYRVRHGGQEFYVHHLMEPIEDAATGAAGMRWFSTLQDITQRQRAEQEVRRLNADLERRVAERTVELEAANKELEAFDYSISHDLRAPINRIAGFSAVLREQYGEQLDARGQHMLARIVEVARDMDQLVGDLFSLSTATRGELKRSTLDVGALGESIVAALRKSEPGRDLLFVAPRGMTAHADPGLLRVVLENLIGNAWKFTSRRDEARIEVGCIDSRGERAWFVLDNGAGFDPANAGKLFAPFQRLHSHNDFKGTGIGLATVQRIVRRHGGRIWAEGIVGVGATFFFTLSA